MNVQVFSSPAPCNLGKQSVATFAERIAQSLNFEAGSDLEQIVENLGGRVKYQDIWSLGLSQSGSIEIEAEDNFEIVLAAHTSKERDNFTIAHELGHYFLHYRLPAIKGQPMQPMRAARYGGDLVEIEANWFAAAFLMPEKNFKEIFASLDGDIPAIARKFGVSSSACSVRAKSLGLLGEV